MAASNEALGCTTILVWSRVQTTSNLYKTVKGVHAHTLPAYILYVNIIIHKYTHYVLIIYTHRYIGQISCMRKYVIWLGHDHGGVDKIDKLYDENESSLLILVVIITVTAVRPPTLHLLQRLVVCVFCLVCLALAPQSHNASSYEIYSCNSTQEKRNPTNVVGPPCMLLLVCVYHTEGRQAQKHPNTWRHTDHKDQSTVQHLQAYTQKHAPRQTSRIKKEVVLLGTSFQLLAILPTFRSDALAFFRVKINFLPWRPVHVNKCRQDW